MLTWEAKHSYLAYCLWYFHRMEHCEPLKSIRQICIDSSRLISKWHCLVQKKKAVFFDCCVLKAGVGGWFFLLLSSYISSFPLSVDHLLQRTNTLEQRPPTVVWSERSRSLVTAVLEDILSLKNNSHDPYLPPLPYFWCPVTAMLFKELFLLFLRSFLSVLSWTTLFSLVSLSHHQNSSSQIH